MRYVEAWKLERLIRHTLAVRHLPPEHIDHVVNGLLTASLRGIDSHGVRLLQIYVRELDGGRSVARPDIRLEMTAPAVGCLHAGNALGLVAGMIATREAIAIARKNGVGVVVVRESNHYGAASYYTLEMARHGMAGMTATNAAPHVAPFNGFQPLFGTNPISFAAPGRVDDVFCLDMATSQICYSTVKHHREVGQSLEPGWTVETPEAGGRAQETLTPLGGYKGQGLAMMVSILSSLLSGATADHEASPFDLAPFDTPRGLGHFFLVFDLAGFKGKERFRERLSDLMNLTRAEPSTGSARILVPGDRARRAMQERERSGIPLEPQDLQALETLARDAGVEL